MDTYSVIHTHSNICGIVLFPCELFTLDGGEMNSCFFLVNCKCFSCCGTWNCKSLHSVTFSNSQHQMEVNMHQPFHLWNQEGRSLLHVSEGSYVSCVVLCGTARFPYCHTEKYFLKVYLCPSVLRNMKKKN